jgi:hypothetical protein
MLIFNTIVEGNEPMSTVVEFRVPVEEFALERTLGKIPDAEFDVERAVPTAAGRVMVVF